MTRSIDNRIEVITPILDLNVITKVRAMLQLPLDDDVKARQIDVHQSNTYVDVENPEQSSQVRIYHELNVNLIQDPHYPS